MIRTLGIIILAVAVFIGLQSVYTVSETEQALILRLGEPVDAVNEVGEPDPGLAVIDGENRMGIHDGGGG